MFSLYRCFPIACYSGVSFQTTAAASVRPLHKLLFFAFRFLLVYHLRYLVCASCCARVVGVRVSSRCTCWPMFFSFQCDWCFVATNSDSHFFLSGFTHQDFCQPATCDLNCLSWRTVDSHHCYIFLNHESHLLSLSNLVTRSRRTSTHKLFSSKRGNSAKQRRQHILGESKGFFGKNWKIFNASRHDFQSLLGDIVYINILFM